MSEEFEEEIDEISCSDAQLLARILAEDDEETYDESLLSNFSSAESYFSDGHIRFARKSTLQPENVIRLHYLSKGSSAIHGDLNEDELNILEEALLTDSEFDEDDYDCSQFFAEVEGRLLTAESREVAEASTVEAGQWDLNHFDTVHSDLKDLVSVLRSDSSKVPAHFLKSFLSTSRSFSEGGRRAVMTALHPRATDATKQSPSSSLVSSREAGFESVFKYSVDLPWSSKVGGPRSAGPASSICMGPADDSLLVGRETGTIAICNARSTVRDRHLWLQPSTSTIASPSRAAKSSWAVSSIATHFDCARSFYLVLAGYACGDVALWEVDRDPEQQGAASSPSLPVKRWVGLHGHSVAWVQFLRSDTPTPTSSAVDGQQHAVDAVSGDRKGFLHKLKIARSADAAYSVEHVCLLDGTSGPLLSLAALPCAPSGSHGGAALGGAQLLSFTLGSLSTSVVQLSPSLKILHKWPMPMHSPAAAALVGGQSAPPSSPLSLSPMAWGWTCRSGLEPEARLLRGVGSAVESLVLSSSPRIVLPATQPSSIAGTSSDEAASSALFQGGFNLLRPYSAQASSSSAAAAVASITVSVGPSINLQMPGIPADSALDSWKLLSVCWLRDRGRGRGEADASAAEVVCLAVGWVVLLAVEERALVVRHCCRTDPPPCAAPFFSPAMLDGKVAAGYSGATFLLQNSVCSARLFSPIDIAEEHASEGHWLDALRSVCSGATATAREDHRGRGAALLLDYLQLALPSVSLPPTSRSILLRHLSLLAASACYVCLRLDRQELLFGEVQQLFQAAGSEAHSAFLLSLEPLVLSKQLQRIPPDTLRGMMLLSQLEADRSADLALPLQLSCRSLELCAVHLRYSLSVEGQQLTFLLQVLSAFLLRKGLLAGYIYITASALGDFSGAFLGAMEHLQSPGGAEVADPAAVASHLLQFMFFTFHNKCYPCGQSGDSGGQRGTASLLQLLLASDPTFSHLRFLYLRDAEGLYFSLAQGLAVLSETACSESDRRSLSEFFALLLKFSRVAGGGDLEPTDSAPDEIPAAAAALYFTHLWPVFCAESFSVPLDAQILSAAISFAASSASPGSGRQWLQVEEALTDLLQRQHALEGSQATSAQVDALLQRLGLHSTALALHSKSHHLVSASASAGNLSIALDFYLRFPRQDEPGCSIHPAYRYLSQLLDSLLQSGSGSDTTAAAEVALSRIAALHELGDSSSFRNLVFCYLCRCLTLTQLLQRSASAPTATALQRDLLAALLSNESAGSASAPFILSSLPSPDLFLLLEQLAVHDPSRVGLCLKKAAVALRVRDHGSIEPAQIIDADGQAMSTLRALCEDRKIYDGLAYLQQLSGQHDKALQSLFNGFQSLLLQTKAAIDKQLQSGDQQLVAVPAAELGATALVEVLCKEGSVREDAVSRLPCHSQALHLVDCVACLVEDTGHSDPDLWFKAFDFLLNQRQSVRQGCASSAKELLAVLLGLSLRALLQHMKAASISPQHIIRRITGQELGVRLGEFRDVLLSMLGAHSTDLAFSGAVGDSLRADLLRLCQHKTSRMRRACYRSEDGLFLDAAADAASQSSGLPAAARRRQQQVLRVSESGLSANGFLPITAPPTHLVAMAEEQEPRRPGSLPARATTTAQFDRIE